MRAVRLLAALALLGALAAALPAASAWEPPALPCHTGIAGTDCGASVLDCAVTAGYRTGSSSYEYVRAACGPELWAPCELVYADTSGNVRTCLLG